MPTRPPLEREVMAMAAEGGLTDFDDLLRLFDVIEQRVKDGKKIVQELNEEARNMRLGQSGGETSDD